MNTPRSAAVTPEAAWAVVKARELNEDLDSRDYFDAGYKAGEEARQKLEIQLAQKDQIYLERLDAFEQVTKRAEAAESKAREMESTYQFGAEVMNRIVIPRVKIEKSSENDRTPIELLIRWLAESKSGDVAQLRAVLEEVVRTDDAALQEIKKLGVEPGAESLRITNLCRAALASVPAETHQVTDICVCHLAYQPHPFVVGTICDAKSETGKANVWLRNDGQWTQDETSPECYLKIGSWNPPPPQVDATLECDERTEAIAAAESAAPGASVNEELKKCLWLMLDGTKPDYSDSRSSLSTRQANINRAWGAYEAAARKTEGAK